MPLSVSLCTAALHGTATTGNPITAVLSSTQKGKSLDAHPCYARSNTTCPEAPNGTCKADTEHAAATHQLRHRRQDRLLVHRLPSCSSRARSCPRCPRGPHVEEAWVLRQQILERLAQRLKGRLGQVGEIKRGAAFVPHCSSGAQCWEASRGLLRGTSEINRMQGNVPV